MHLDLITEIPKYRSEHHAKKYIVEWSGSEHTSTTAIDFLGMVDGYTHYLAERGISKGMHVASYSASTRTKMLAAEFAAMRLGAIICPLLTNVTRHDFHAIVKNIAPKFCLVMDEASADLMRQKALKPYKFECIPISEGPLEGNPGDTTEIEPGDPALLISTSGTSGEPKGVLLSHGNITSIVLASCAVVPISRQHIFMSFLPASHILERMALYVTMLQGADIHIAEDPRHGYRLLRKVHPHFFTAVPRNLERIFARFHHASSEAGFFRRQVYNWALRQAQKDTQPGKTLSRWFVMGRLRSVFGVRLKGIIVGGAAMNVEIIRWYEAAGIKVRQGYGLSEVAGVATFNRFKAGEYDLDSVGLPLPGVRIHFEKADGTNDGEILIESPGLMMGYVVKGRLQAREAEKLATGDLGYVDRKGFLHITGRMADTFKNSSGQYVSPARIENILRIHPAIDQVLLYGLGKPFNVAVVVPDFEFLEAWAREKDIHWTAPEYMIHNPEIMAYYQSLIDYNNDQLSPHERIGELVLVPDDWTVDNGLLTSTLKLRREAIANTYSKLLASIYRQANF